MPKRCQASLSEEKSASDEVNLGTNGISIKMGKNERIGASFPIATSKEIEFELQSFLYKARKSDGLDFIFIFDELDKLIRQLVFPITMI